MRVDSDQIRTMPLHVQEQVGVALANQMAKALSVAGGTESQGEKRMLKCDPRVFARCQYNSMCLSPAEAEFTEGSDCHLFSERVLKSPATNADRIRGMNDMELATFLYTATRACADHNCAACPIGQENCTVLLHWLKKKEVEETQCQVQNTM